MSDTSDILRTLTELSIRWESLDPKLSLKDSARFIEQGQKDVKFLLDLIESYAREIDDLQARLDQERNVAREEIQNLKWQISDMNEGI
jgi:hypothetical protein